MPLRILDVDDVDGRDSDLQERHVIIQQGGSRLADEAPHPEGFGHRVHQPRQFRCVRRARALDRKLRPAFTDHVEQDHGARPIPAQVADEVLRTQQVVIDIAFAPVVFAVEEHQIDAEARIPLREDARQFEQNRDTARAVVGPRNREHRARCRCRDRPKADVS